ncbi:MAG: hypothetical protein IJD98_04800 [Oscillospiraceae bacterium]|nr:hypothetical protein [Oscillospiraceae bacterium]
MKKYNEGYALAFVMVILVVLFVIVSLVLPMTVRNHEAQLRAIEMMKDKYAAQGAIEVLVAKLENIDEETEWYPAGVEEITLKPERKVKLEAYINEFCGELNISTDNRMEYERIDFEGELTEIEAGEWEFTFFFKVSSTFNVTKVTCEVKLKESIVYEGFDLDDGANAYTISPPQVSYVVYDISHVEPETAETTSSESINPSESIGGVA